MKKAIDQTVRELKREVNKKVLKVPGIEQKILEATSNEPWGPHGSILADIAQATQNYHEYQIIINVIWKRINDTGKNWRHVYKALSVLEYLVAHGSERVIDDIREHSYQIATLSDFNYIDSAGRDQGNNVRRKSQTLVALVNDKDRVKEVREKALANRDKFRTTFSTPGRFRPGSYGSSGGGYGDRYDDDRYGNRDGDRNEYGRERDWGYKDDDRYGSTGDSYNRDGDRYGRDAEERYGRDAYRDNDYREGRGNDDELGSRNRNYDKERTSFEDNNRYSSRSASARADDTFQGERQFQRNFSDQNVRAPPSYEESTGAHNNVQGGGNQGAVAAQAPQALPPPASKVDPRQSANQGPKNVVNDVPPSAHNVQTSLFDDFDPRDSLPATVAAANPYKMNYSGTLISDPANSLALVPVGYSSYTEADTPTNSGYGTSFVTPSSSSIGVNQPNEDPFGESPFKASQKSISAHQHNSETGTQLQTTAGLSGGAPPPAPVPPKMETSSSLGFEDTLLGLTSTNGYGQQSSAASYTPNANVQQPSANTLLASNLPAAEASNVPNTRQPHPGSTALASSQEMQPAAQRNLQTAPTNLLHQPEPSASKMPAESTSKAHPSKDKFEPKSTIWADSLNRGLVNLNISGTKINPLADIGIDFDSLNRREKRNEMGKTSAASLTSTTSMGKAMVAGSSMVRTGSGTSMSSGAGMGARMGMAGSINRPTGMAMNMGAGMGMNTQGARPSGPGMPNGGGGYNPMMGMGGYASQQHYGGGYR